MPFYIESKNDKAFYFLTFLEFISDSLTNESYY